MNIAFKYNGLQNNNPTEERHITIQNSFKQKVDNLIEPIKNQLGGEPFGYIIINYVDEHIDRPFIEIHGFSGGNTVQLLMLLKVLAD